MGANLCGANLMYVDLCGSFLRKAYLLHVNLSGADLCSDTPRGGACSDRDDGNWATWKRLRQLKAIDT